MRLLARFLRWCPGRGRNAAWGIGILVLLPVPGSGAEEQGADPRAIIGGEVAEVEGYPFTVFVRLPDRKLCTGTLVAPDWVLTAAHCVMDEDGTFASLRIVHDYARSLGGLDPVFRNSKRIIPHPEFQGKLVNSERIPHDIALIELSAPFPASYAAPLALADRSAEQRRAPSGMSAVAVGYGRSEPDRVPGYPEGMMYALTQLYHAEDCKERLTIKAEEEVVFGDAICAGSATTRADRGDSGGPLMVAYAGEGDPQWLQVGVASRGARDVGSGEFITIVYSRVSSYADWIRETTGGDVSPIGDTSTTDIEQITNGLTQVRAQIRSEQVTVRALQRDRAQIREAIGGLIDAWEQDASLRVTQNGILESALKASAQ